MPALLLVRKFPVSNPVSHFSISALMVPVASETASTLITLYACAIIMVLLVVVSITGYDNLGDNWIVTALHSLCNATIVGRSLTFTEKGRLDFTRIPRFVPL